MGTDHTELILSPQDALSLIPDLPSVYDEPFADASQLPTQLLMRLRRAHVTVGLSGDGGDELFGGYNRYRLVPALWSGMKWIPKQSSHRHWFSLGFGRCVQMGPLPWADRSIDAGGAAGRQSP